MQKTFFFLLFISFLATGCASMKQNRWLSEHHKKLQALADSNVSAEQKLNGMVQDYVLFMKEDLKFADPVKGVKYVKKYHHENEAAMDKILHESEQWQGKLNLTEKLTTGVRFVQKPYFKDLVELAPKFKRKYKQYAFAVKLASKVTGGLTKLAGKELGD